MSEAELVKEKPDYVYIVKLTLSEPLPEECFQSMDELGRLISDSPIVLAAKVLSGRVRAMVQQGVRKKRSQ